MKRTDKKLSDVQAVYSGAEGTLWELIMGEQIHVGGMNSSMELAKNAGIKEGMHGCDLCCCNGAGMRFLAENFKTEMTGVDATDKVIETGKARNEARGLADKVNFVKGDVTDIPIEDEKFDFVWGEDAWCYVEDKERLISEAARVLKPGGTIAFTDWVEGPAGMTDDEADRVNTFMKFPYMESISGYKKLLEENGFEIKEANQIDFAEYVDLYIQMLTKQLTSDALRIIGNDMELFQAMGGEMMNMSELAHANKMTRGRFIAIKK